MPRGVPKNKEMIIKENQSAMISAEKYAQLEERMYQVNKETSKVTSPDIPKAIIFEHPQYGTGYLEKSLKAHEPVMIKGEQVHAIGQGRYKHSDVEIWYFPKMMFFYVLVKDHTGANTSHHKIPITNVQHFKG